MPVAALGSEMAEQDIESELSYAYLHAVASAAGVACQQTTRARDNLGIDASLDLRREFAGSPCTELAIKVQLKATIRPPRPKRGRVSYWLDDLDEYNRLRLPRAIPPRVLVVLFLPNDAESWLEASPEELLLKNAAYWVSLVGAPESSNSSGQTIYLPEVNLLSPRGLIALFERVARGETLFYAA